MTLAPDVDLEEFVLSKDELSGADIKVILIRFLIFLILIFNLNNH